MDKIKILVAVHKNAPFYCNNVYIPIHVGKALSSINLGISGDNTGENISTLNPYYCELTAQYWAWKNITNIEYIGLCHYRRYFKTEFTEDNIDEIMNGYDIVLARRIYFKTNLLNWYSQNLTPEDIDLFYIYMNSYNKSHIDKFEQFYMCQNWLNPANMFVCKKHIFDDFCEWQFKILNDLFTVIPKSPYTRGKRLMGYLGESLLPFYVYYKGLRVKEMPITPMIGNPNEYNKQSLVRKIKCNILFTKGSRLYKIPEDRIVGLKNDSLIHKINSL